MVDREISLFPGGRVQDLNLIRLHTNSCWINYYANKSFGHLSYYVDIFKLPDVK